MSVEDLIDAYERNSFRFSDPDEDDDDEDDEPKDH